MNRRELSPSAVRAAREIRVIVGRVRRRIRDASTADDLTPSQASVLAWLSRYGPNTASGLAAIEGVRPQSMATTVSTLAGLGLVERSPDPDDGRRQLVTLTDDGRDRAEGDRRARHEWLARALQERCSESERETVIAAMGILDRLIAP